MPNIKLQSSEGQIFDIDVQIAKCSGTIKTMLDACGIDDGENAVIPLPNVDAATLSKVLDWAHYHKDDREQQIDEDVKRTDDIPEWDVNFLNVDQGTLFNLIAAANYLDIKGLFQVGCKTVANMIKGKTPEEIRKTFNIKNDLTPDNRE